MRASRVRGLLALFILPALGTALAGCPQYNEASGLYTVTFDGTGRTFELYIPSTYNPAQPTPLVLVYHTLGATGKEASGLTEFVGTAERYGFVVAFPDAIDGVWNTFPEGFDLPRDGLDREPLGDDLDFTAAIIDGLSAYLNIDRDRVYATGASNGGMMSYWLAMKMPDRFAAVAPVMATMPAMYLDDAPPVEPIPICIIHGTDDPVLPYDGGRFLGLPDFPSIFPLRGDQSELRFLSAAETVAYWCERNEVDPAPVTVALPDLDPDDGAAGRLVVYGGGAGGAEVLFCEVVGGGHTWPGGPQYLPSVMIGNTCRDFHAAEMIWAFFERHASSGQ